MRLCVLLRSAKLTAIGNNTLTIRTFLFSPPLSAQAHACTASFASSFSTGPPGDRGALHCRCNVIATQPLGLVSFQARGILPVAEEQSLYRAQTLLAYRLSSVPSPPPTQSLHPGRSGIIVCNGRKYRIFFFSIFEKYWSTQGSFESCPTVFAGFGGGGAFSYSIIL